MPSHTHLPDDEHHHHHVVPLEGINKAFIIGIALNLLFVIIETVAGLIVHSLSLLSDAGHNLADVASLALSLLAFRLVKMKPTEKFTYGFSKTTILVALFNAMVLMVSIGAIGYEAIHRFLHPEPLDGTVISIIAAIGIVINGTTALMFFRGKDSDLNIKSAYLHLLSDAVVSLGIVIGGIVIFYTHYFWIDAALSIIIAVVVLLNTWSLLSQSLKLSLDAVPENLTLQQVKEAAEKIPGVKNMHHIHLWAISTTRNALTAHIVVDSKNQLSDIETIKHKVKHELEHLNIQHATLEVEPDEEICETEEC
jgi:cobalt-zinc-cadmium efflux system protein